VSFPLKENIILKREVLCSSETLARTCSAQGVTAEHNMHNDDDVHGKNRGFIEIDDTKSSGHC
jgi:hypothetical protein